MRPLILISALLLSAASGSSQQQQQPPQGPVWQQPPPPGGGGGQWQQPAPQQPQQPQQPAPQAGGGSADDLQFCVDETNRYRATLGLPALRRNADLERCAAEGAAADARSQTPHGHFSATKGCGIAFAENEIPWWSADFGGGTVRGTMQAGLKMMWDEGPGGGHYENMKGNYTEVGCGVFVSGGTITVVQDFK